MELIHSLWLLLLMPLAWGILLLVQPFARARVDGVVSVVLYGGLSTAGWLLLRSTGQVPGTVIELPVHWQLLKNYSVNSGIYIDYPTAWMVFIVGLVGSCVALYSCRYMQEETHRSRYFAYLSLFVFAMLGIVLVRDLLLIYVGWELVGLCSYLLIGFWHERSEARRAALQAFVTNRLGDAAFVVGIGACLLLTGSTDLLQMQQTLPWWAALCLFGGTMGKSAQFPLHFWLPDAMAGPTPASALIHAATMVAAGVYLLFRLHPLFPDSTLLVIAGLALITILWSALLACVQKDMKRVLAYSTVSQLGYMILAIALHNPAGGFAHLLTHAFFKAGLFLSVGAVIYYLHHWQEKKGLHFDAQNMFLTGGWARRALWLAIPYGILAAALAGFPLTAGALSKENIIMSVWASHARFGQVAYYLGSGAILGALLTAFYMGRQTGLIWLRPAPPEQAAAFPAQPHATFIIPLALLSVGSLWFWWSPNPMSLEAGAIWQRLKAPETSLPHAIGYLTSAGALFMFALGAWLYGFSPKGKTAHNEPYLQPLARLLYRFCCLQDRVIRYLMDVAKPNEQTESIWLQDRLTAWGLKLCRAAHQFDSKGIDRLINGLGKITVVAAHVIAWTDRQIVDGMVKAIAGMARLAAYIGSRLQSGILQEYAWIAIVALALIVLGVAI
jgi:NADH-quinone oxidoreductase subunit L